jgi:integrase
MKVYTITHESGDLLPLLLDSDGLPIPAPNEFIISRRFLSANTLVRDLRGLAVLYQWLKQGNFDLDKRLKSARSFKEAEIKGGLVEFLRRDQESRRKVRKIAVTATTFNQRLSTVRQYLSWYCDIFIGSLPSEPSNYDRALKNKKRLLDFLDTSFINAPPTNRVARKGLNFQEIEQLLTILDPNNSEGYGINPAVNHRNYVLTMIMLYYGLRPGELLSLRVQDIEIGAISSIRVQRRYPDVKDTRRPRPQIKRNGRILPIQDKNFAKILDVYITEWRVILEEKSESETDYLILSDDGKPLSQSSITQLFQTLRRKYSKALPSHLTAKSLRHTFSSDMEKVLRQSGMEEDRRKQALAYLRGDSSLSSQENYIAQEIEAQANIALRKYQSNLIMEDVSW